MMKLFRVRSSRPSLTVSFCFIFLLHCLILSTTTTSSFILFANGDETSNQNDEKNRVLLSFGLVADNHYDTFPAGEKAPWEPLQHWFQEQLHRTLTTKKRRYDIAKDKMDESIAVFNQYQHPTNLGEGLDMVVNLGDLVNNDLMWNLKPILDSFNNAKAPHFHLIGNHDLRAHNDRFGKVNATQHRWIQEKLGLSKEWYYTLKHAPFHLLFLDSMVLEPESKNVTKKREHMTWIDEQLATSSERGEIVILFAHIPIGFQTNILAPILKKYQHIALAFFGHDHRGGYIVQGVTHCVTLHGQIEMLTNAFAVVEVFADRVELSGFGRVPSRVLSFPPPIVQRMQAHLATKITASPGGLGQQGNQPAPPSVLWPKEEVLQEPPLLLLNIPNYRKPNVPAAKPNESAPLTRYIAAWKLLPPAPPKTPSPEPPVDLTSALKGKKPTILAHNVISDGIQKVASEQQQQQQQNSNSVLNSETPFNEDDSFVDVEEEEDCYLARKNHHPSAARLCSVMSRHGGGGASTAEGNNSSPAQGWVYHAVVVGPLLLTAALATVVLVKVRRGRGGKLRQPGGGGSGTGVKEQQA